MPLPDAVAALVAAPVTVGSPAQAFPFLTVDEAGLPHVALLSGSELRVGPDGALLAALASPTTVGNLRRTGAATIVAVEGTTAHSVKLRVRSLVDGEPPFVGCVLDVVSHKADSLGIPLSAMGFVPTDDLARLERWEATDRLLRSLASTGQ